MTRLTAPVCAEKIMSDLDREVTTDELMTIDMPDILASRVFALESGRDYG